MPLDYLVVGSTGLFYFGMIAGAAVALVKILKNTSPPQGPNLVPCPDCRRPVSRFAQACPTCGRPLKV